MKQRSTLMASWPGALAGAVLCVLLGVAFLQLGLGDRLVHLGYDLVFLFRGTPRFDEIEIIYMDDQSFAELGSGTRRTGIGISMRNCSTG